MRLMARARIRASIALLCALALMGCAASIPSVSSGTSKPSFGSLGDVPKRIAVRSGGIAHYDPVGDVLRAELPTLGFLIVPTDAEALVTAVVKYSDYSPVRLEVSISDARTGTTIWSAQVVRKWDIYASVVSASESNARKAMELLRRDLASAKVQR